MLLAMRTKGRAEASDMRPIIGAKLLQEGRAVREVSALLSAEQKRELQGIPLKDARAAWFPTDLWTVQDGEGVVGGHGRAAIIMRVFFPEL